MLDAKISRDDAIKLLKKYNKDEFHLEHAFVVEGLMRYFASKEDPQNIEFWGIVGLLHDLDWEEFDPNDHTIKTAEILAEVGADPFLAHSIQTHQSDRNENLPKPEHIMQKRLYASDELSGLICACIKVRPSKSVMDMNLKSLKKKYKIKNFAAGCSRDDIEAAAILNGWELDELMQNVIDGMKSFAPDKDTFNQEILD